LLVKRKTGTLMRKQSSVGSWVAALVVLLGIVVAGLYFLGKGRQAPVSSVPPSPPAVAGTAPAPIQHPITQANSGPASASTAPLPALDASDASVAAALAALAGDSDLSSLLRQQVIARIVATIDALPRRSLGTMMLPVHTPKGAFVTDEVDGSTVIGAGNAGRYAPYMRVVEATDPKALVAWYVHAYPLFQKAYEQLGYPKGYFNDRLVVAIDDLLAAPEPTSPPAVVHPQAFYVYADPALESLSAGQRLMLRVGTANEAKIKAKLRAIRAELTGQMPPAGAHGAG
jgi:hypothetical protein